MKQYQAHKTGREHNRFTARKQRGAHTSNLLLLLILAHLLLACSVLGGDPNPAYPGPEAGSDAPVAGASLTCSQECADRGQCGDSADRGRVVLLSSDAPAVAAVDFELAIADNAAVNVLELRSVEVLESATGFQFPINFYRVHVPERNVEGWVSAWCILNPGS